MAADFDTVVVGAGVIGLAIARKLALSGQQVLVLEKAVRAGTETSSRNSEVIHAGIYYPTGSLKARLCVAGRKLLFDYCASYNVDTSRPGKLIVATNTEEEAKLKSIAALALANGVDDLQWLSQADVAKREPAIRCTSALLSPSTGIIDAAGLMLSLQGDAETGGADFAFNTTCKKVEKRDGLFIVNAGSANGEASEVTCKHLVNCAGHGAHKVATTIAAYQTRNLPPQHFAKGSYCSLSGPAPFAHLIYPVPVSGALGIHATPDFAGGVRFGPDIQWVDGVDYALQANLPDIFVHAIKNYWPDVRNRTLTPSYCGIRPKIHSPQQGFADFDIQLPEAHGIAGLINLFGIESPGLTASLAIAEFVERHLQR